MPEDALTKDERNRRLEHYRGQWALFRKMLGSGADGLEPTRHCPNAIAFLPTHDLNPKEDGQRRRAMAEQAYCARVITAMPDTWDDLGETFALFWLAEEILDPPTCCELEILRTWPKFELSALLQYLKAICSAWSDPNRDPDHVNLIFIRGQITDEYMEQQIEIKTAMKGAHGMTAAVVQVIFWDDFAGKLDACDEDACLRTWSQADERLKREQRRVAKVIIQYRKELKARWSTE